MKAKVLYPYVDRHTMEPRERGEVVELTAERGKELEGLGFVEAVEDAVEDAKPAPKPRTRKPAPKKGE